MRVPARRLRKPGRPRRRPGRAHQPLCAAATIWYRAAPWWRSVPSSRCSGRPFGGLAARLPL